MIPSCCQLRRSWPVMQLGPPHWNMCLKGRCQYIQSTQSTLRHRLILVTSYHRSMILTNLTETDILQPEHTALPGTVKLKPHTTTLYTCFRLESATFVSDIYSAEQCALMIMQGACSDHIDPLWCNHEHCENEITWEGRVWNTEGQVWDFLICYSCVGPTSQHCADGGSCCNGDAAPRGRQIWSRPPGVENGWTMDDDHFDAVVINDTRSQTTGNTQLHRGFVHTTYVFANTQQDLVDINFESMNNEADIFTVLPLLLRDLRAVLGCLLSRIQQYCVVQQSVSLS